MESRQQSAARTKLKDGGACISTLCSHAGAASRASHSAIGSHWQVSCRYVCILVLEEACTGCTGRTYWGHDFVRRINNVGSGYQKGVHTLLSRSLTRDDEKPNEIRYMRIRYLSSRFEEESRGAKGNDNILTSLPNLLESDTHLANLSLSCTLSSSNLLYLHPLVSSSSDLKHQEKEIPD